MCVQAKQRTLPNGQEWMNGLGMGIGNEKKLWESFQGVKIAYPENPWSRRFEQISPVEDPFD